MGAAAEALLLNDASLGAMAPKALRFPAILTSSLLVGLRRGGAPDVSRDSRRYRLLEPDAVGLALGCAAAEPGREIVVPRWERSFSALDAARFLSSATTAVAAAHANGRAGEPGEMGPVFETE
jgi:hypothetical protein